ncbi:MAG: hypothetical protein R3E68_00735 [Burkholderiaceae bacterium]
MSRVVLITATSAKFFEPYLDLLDSLAAVGLRKQYDIGLIDLGLTPGQRELLRLRGAQIQPARWPVCPPPEQDRIEFVSFVARPWAREFFPGYDTYVWMDADMWVQSADFWAPMMEGARRTGLAVPAEIDEDYGPPPMSGHLWMLKHLRAAIGLPGALRLLRRPMINNGLFAMRADAPHWGAWQRYTSRLVERAHRTVAVDQVALFLTIHRDRLPTHLLGASANWVCSLAVPGWDDERQRFITPGPSRRAIDVIHNTTPSRGRRFTVVGTSGATMSRFLHRPGGHFVGQLLGAASIVVEPAQGEGDGAPLDSGATPQEPTTDRDAGKVSADPRQRPEPVT